MTLLLIHTSGYGCFLQLPGETIGYSLLGGVPHHESGAFDTRIGSLNQFLQNIHTREVQ